jgi:hypothetical protein
LLLPPFVGVTVIFLHETNESGFREKISLNYAARKNESRWEMGMPLFQVGLVHAFIGHRTATPEQPSWFVGLSCLSRSSNQTIETDQQDQIDQIRSRRGQMVSGPGSFPAIQNVPVFLSLSISFLNNALAGWPFFGRVNSLIMRTIYGHLTRR